MALDHATSEDVSEELSITLGLAQRLRSKPCTVDSGYDRLLFIFNCLLVDPPKLILARDERLRLQVELYQQSGWLSRTLARISAGSPVALVLTALCASLIIWAVVFWIVRLLSGLTEALPIFFMDGKAFGIMAFAALIGGVVSIATRLREFSRVRDLDPFAMFWTALLKPLVGVVLALFILATLAGDVVSLGFLGADPLSLNGGGRRLRRRRACTSCGFSASSPASAKGSRGISSIGRKASRAAAPGLPSRPSAGAPRARHRLNALYATAARLASLRRSFEASWRLRRRIERGVTSTSSSSPM